MWGIAPSEQLSQEIWARIYQLYVTSYGDVVFKSPQELKIYPCSVYFFHNKVKTTPPFHINLLENDCQDETEISKMNPNHINSFMLVQSRNFAYKITLIGHEGTNISKQNLFDKLAKLLVTPGYIFETRRGSISAKILRARYNLIPILDKETIVKLLDAEELGDRIQVIGKFRYSDPNDYVYHRYSKDLKIEGLLFGIGCPTEGFVSMEFKGPMCERRCQYI